MFIKPKLTPADAIKAANLYYKFSDPICTGLGGIPNSSFRIQERAIDIVVKIYSLYDKSTTPRNIINSVKFITHVASFGINTLDLHKGRDGHILQHYNGYPVLCSTYINGDNLSEIAWTDETLTNVGMLLAKINKAGRDFSFNGGYSKPLHSLLSDYIRDYLHITDPFLQKSFDAIHEKIPEIITSIKCIESRYKKQICHMDIWPYNLILDMQGDLHLIDFDDWQCCCYLAEVAANLLEFSMFETHKFNYHYFSKILAIYLDHHDAVIAFEDLLWLMRYFCVVWFGYNAVESTDINDALIYDKKLKTLYDPQVVNLILNFGRHA